MINQLLKSRYQIINKLSEKGGFGITYIAQDLQTKIDCVVKELRFQYNDHDKAKELFEREAKSLQILGIHDQIPTFIDYFHENQQFYLVQEFIDGFPLTDELDQGNIFNENQVIQLLQNILEPLTFVHQKQIIHRDLKPDNLIRRKKDNKIVLIDFGAVKKIATQMGFHPATQIYTKGYAPSEQYIGNPQYSSDIYALGVIAIQALTGVPKIDSIIDENTNQIIWKNQVKISQELANILDKMIQDNWQNRYQNANEVLQVLKPLISPPVECPACLAENPPNSAYCLICGYTLSIPNPSPISTHHLKPNTLLKQGTYKIEKTLGEGGFGITYQGIYTPNNAVIAIKELFPEKSARQGNSIMWANSISPQEKQQQIYKFKLEASNQQKCNHPNIPKVYDWFDENNTVYIVMEFITGKSLFQILQTEGILAEERVKKYSIQVTEALIIIHKNNFLHRDIKPDNIIINHQDQAVLIDFGAAKEFIAGQTRLMTQILTKGYAPLEQYSEKSKRFPATDIYALCASMYELLTGELPAEATDRMQGLLQGSDTLIPPRQINPKISPFMEKVILIGMKINVSERWQTAKKLNQTLRDRRIIDPAHEKAREYVKNNQLVEAIQAYESCIINDPNNGEIALELALVQIHLNHNKAEIYAEKAIDLNPQDGRGYGVLGLVKCRQEKWQEAVTFLEKAVSLSPQEVWINANFAWALGKINNWQKAETIIDKTLQIDQNCTFALGVKSWIAVNQKQWQIAVGSATKTILLCQQNPLNDHQEIQKWVYPHLVFAFDQSPKINQNTQNIEQKRLEEFIKYFPQEPFAWGFKAWKQAKEGLYNEAVTCFNQIINQPNIDDWILINYGIIQEYLNNIQGAISLYEKVNQNAFSLFRLGTLSGRLGQWQNAKNYLEKAIKLQPNYAEACHNLGWVLLNIKTSDGTIEYHQDLWTNYRQAVDFYSQKNQINFVQNIKQSFQSAGLTI